MPADLLSPRVIDQRLQAPAYILISPIDNALGEKSGTQDLATFVTMASCMARFLGFLVARMRRGLTAFSNGGRGHGQHGGVGSGMVW